MRRGLVLVLIVLFAVSAKAQQDIAGTLKFGWLSEQNAAYNNNAALADNVSPQIFGAKKSILNGVIFSLLLPGAGQWYAGDRFKAIGFILAEVSMWYGNNHYNDEGDRIDAEFRAYADLNWDKNDYLNWLAGLDEATRSAFSHHLPETNTQQYYEMIGKYEQFLAGWPDSGGAPDDSEIRHYYMSRQDASNDQYKKAELMANLMLLNRVVSAVEAAISIHRKSSVGVQPGFSFRISPDRTHIIPEAGLTIQW
ncbi:hypothetical protein ACFL67_00290 [candidate division KSB1 bacterium]